MTQTAENKIPGETVLNEGMLQSLESLYCFHSGFKSCSALKKKMLKLSQQYSKSELLMLVSHLGNSHVYSRLPEITDALTNNETYFFRDEIQFDCLQQYLLPALFEQKLRSGDKTLRIWSAACSSGEEAYSLSMVVADFMLKKGLARLSHDGSLTLLEGWKVQICGSDINKRVIVKAKSAQYSASGLSSFRHFPQQFNIYIKKMPLNKESAKSFYRVNRSIQSLTAFEVFNLNSDELPLSLQRMDIVFCRNVMIYWHEETQARVLANIYKAMNKNAYLLMSAVDKMNQPRLFNEKRFKDHTVYLRR
ncbi:MAG: hypothetical protein HRU20_11295 [Pseudomonadales bacterium]|nr:hypothetical protein [Pseudomonadales bacterium]